MRKKFIVDRKRKNCQYKKNMSYIYNNLYFYFIFYDKYLII